MTQKELIKKMNEHCLYACPVDMENCPAYKPMDNVDNVDNGWHGCKAADRSEEELAAALAAFDAAERDDPVSHPSHYTNGGMECIDEMVLIFGREATAHFCLCNAWKYRRRALYKNGEEDIQKSHWYIAKFKELTENG